MRKINLVGATFSLVFTLGCSSMPGASKSGEDLAASGPTVVNTRANPETVELDRNYNAKTGAEVITEVKDFSAKVVDVKLRFVNAPVEIPMQHVSGTTWRATLTSGQLKTLGVGNQTTQHEATVIARDSSGAVAKSKTPVQISIKGPDLSRDLG